MSKIAKIFCMVLIFNSFTMLKAQWTTYWPNYTGAVSIATNANVMNTGDFAVNFNGSSLRGFCWDGDNPSFGIEYNGLILIQYLDGNSLGIVFDPDIVIDPRSMPNKRIVITYVVDTDNKYLNGTPSDVRYEVWIFDGTSLSLDVPSTLVNQNAFFNDQPNIDISALGEIAIVYHNGFNSLIVGIPSIDSPLIQTSYKFVELPCILTCSSWLPDVALIYDESLGYTKVAVSFLHAESNYVPPIYLSEHSFNYSQLLATGGLPCDSYNLLYQSTLPDNFVGIPRIDAPPFSDNGITYHPNDFHITINTIEDADIGGLTYIRDFSKTLNGSIVEEVPSTNNYPSGSMPPWWTSSSFVSNNPFYHWTTYGGIDYSFNLGYCTNYNPVTSFCNDTYVDAWNLYSDQILGNGNSAYPGCENPSIPDHISIYTNTIARQLDNYGVVSKAAISIVSEHSNLTLADQLIVSVTGKFDPNSDITYFYYAKGTNELMFKTRYYSNNFLKRNIHEANIGEQSEISEFSFFYAQNENLLKIYFRDYHSVRISITDISGKVVQTGLTEMIPGENNFQLSNLLTGFYNIHVLSDDGLNVNKKVLVLN